MTSNFPAVIDLNVGGRHLTTSLSTLTKYPDSMLAAMFSGRQSVKKDKDDRYFIDVDGDVFAHVLNFLRFETMPPPEAAADVWKYADYFGLDVLKESIPNVQQNGEALYDIWRTNLLKVTNYTRYWKDVECQLKNLNFASMYVSLIVKTRSSHTKCTHATPGRLKIEVQLLDKDDCRSVINLLAHDIQRLGIFIYETDVSCSCMAYKGIQFRIK